MKQAEVGGVLLDVSIFSDNGPRAACWLLQQQGTWPALQPLTIALKALLADADLTDPSRGGLGTWALCNMALALLKKRAHEGLGCEDTGVILLHFLTFFGGAFDYAVSFGDRSLLA
jgi:non-canonical poly(A) RNA polymerase PAPD5/7